MIFIGGLLPTVVNSINWCNPDLVLDQDEFDKVNTVIHKKYTRAFCPCSVEIPFYVRKLRDVYVVCTLSGMDGNWHNTVKKISVLSVLPLATWLSGRQREGEQPYYVRARDDAASA